MTPGTTNAGPGARRAGLAALLPCAALAVAVLVAYARSYTVPFQLDDLLEIAGNRAVHVTSLTPGALWTAARGYTVVPGARWLPMVTFGLNHYAGGQDVLGYHVVNVAIHVANCWLVLLLARRLLALSEAVPPGARERVALLAALLFAVHPVATSAVTYVVQRWVSLGASFALVAVLAYLRARTAGPRRWRWAGVAVASALLAYGCKQSFASLPLTILLVDLVLFPDFAEVARRRWRSMVLGGAVAIAAAGAAFVAYAPFIAAENQRFELTLLQRLVTQGRVVWGYLSLLALPLPSRLHLDHVFGASDGLLTPPTTLLGLLGVAALIAVAVAARRRRAGSLVALAIAWFLGGLVVETSVLPVDLFFEHRLYFPGVVVMLLAAVGLERAAARWGLPGRGWALGAPVVLLLVAATHVRHDAWNDPVGEAASVVAAGPPRGAAAYAYPRSLVVLARHAVARDDLAAAEAYARRAVDALEAPEPMFVLGAVLLDQGRLDEAQLVLGSFLERHPCHRPWVWLVLADVQAEAGRRDLAEATLRRALAHVDREVDEVHEHLGALYLDAGEPSAAVDAFSAALGAGSAKASVHARRADALLRAGRPAEAIEDAARALARDPSACAALAVRGDALATLRRFPEAVESWGRGLQCDPGASGLHLRIARVAYGAGDYAAAEDHVRAELRLSPQDPAATTALRDVLLARRR
jgi:tetratricopeptide (TPR) repeat protein